MVPSNQFQHLMVFKVFAISLLWQCCDTQSEEGPRRMCTMIVMKKVNHRVLIV
jgi:hypothetical protein